jgi:LPXTG-site transpeptidase (sortase) family protein
MTPINHEQTAVHRATMPSATLRDRRSFLVAGAGAGAALLLGSRSLLAAPVQQADDEIEDPWESGACEVRDDEDERFDDEEQDGDEAADLIIPLRVLIPEIDVDARVEVLEIVGDTLQDPSNGEDVAWYKETALPGEDGNAVIAGHLNWYNMPEGVFFAINQLQEGDEVLVRDSSCAEFRYVVEWVELIEVANADMHEITGPSEQALLTLITCGGTWDPSISQYRERTVVRARLDGKPRPSSRPEAADDEAEDEDAQEESADSDAGNDNDLGDADADADAGDTGSTQIVPRD